MSSGCSPPPARAARPRHVLRTTRARVRSGATRSRGRDDLQDGRACHALPIERHVTALFEAHHSAGRAERAGGETLECTLVAVFDGPILEVRAPVVPVEVVSGKRRLWSREDLSRPLPGRVRRRPDRWAEVRRRVRDAAESARRRRLRRRSSGTMSSRRTARLRFR